MRQAQRGAASEAYLAQARAVYAQQAAYNRHKLDLMARPQPPKPPHGAGAGAQHGQPHGAAAGQFPRGHTPFGAVPQWGPTLKNEL